MPNVALALYILYERFRMEDSFWKPYLNFLPPEYSTVLYFSSQDLLHMKGSPTFESAMKQCRNIFRQYAHFKRLFQVRTLHIFLIIKVNVTIFIFMFLFLYVARVSL
ncbi:hypothetical protein WDU94_011825 [Cyamophila willieti]